MTAPSVIEIREPGMAPRRVTVDRAIGVGRDQQGAVLVGTSVSLAHLKLMVSPVALSIVNLGDSGAAFVNGRTIEGRAILGTGDTIRFGTAEIEVLSCPAASPTRPAPGTARPAPETAPSQPVPQPAPTREPGPMTRVAGQVFLGPIPKLGQPVFRNYTELPRHVPISAWRAVRVVSVAVYVALVTGLFVSPAGALFAFFNVTVPLLPVVFFVSPGLWRNICPLAAVNQAPRVFGFTRAFSPPGWMRRHGFVIAFVLFFGITSARIAVFNTDGRATGILLAATIASAFLGGVLFTGKSGWCSSICPLLPLQRAYGQTPFVRVPNSHCQPCVGCTKNCYDYKPQVAYQADMRDADSNWVSPRKLFAAALPGFVLGFFTLTASSHPETVEVYELLALYSAGSIASFYLLDALLPVTSRMLTALYPAAAINIFYWYASIVLADSFHTATGAAIPWVRWPIRAIVGVLTLIWITRTFAAGRRFEQEVSGRPARVVQVGFAAAKAMATRAKRSFVQVRFAPGDTSVDIEVGTSLLEAAEKAGQQIEAGCRMGVCGADPVAVIDGMAGLTPPTRMNRTPSGVSGTRRKRGWPAARGLCPGPCRSRSLPSPADGPAPGSGRPPTIAR